jgi:hypothetical protein
MPNIIGLLFPEMETRGAAVINMQTEIFATLDRINRDCFDRAKSEARLASELSAKLTAARSVHDVTAAYQKWHSERLKTLADDSCRLYSESRKFIEMGIRFLYNSHPGAAP